MRSQLDDLLNELEGDLSSDPLPPARSSKPSIPSKPSKNELDDLLDFMKDEDSLPIPKVSYRPAPQPSSKPRYFPYSDFRNVIHFA